MVRIALDATYAAYPEPTGIGIYSQRLISALAASLPSGDECRLSLCFRFGPYVRRALWQPWPAGCSLVPLFESGPWMRCMQLFHGLNQRLPKKTSAAQIVTIHDLFPLTSPDFSTH